MKKLFTILAAIFLTASMFAQAPQKMSYQAAIRNASNALVTLTQVGMRISILKDSATGTAVYIETQTPTTNNNGLISIEIGGGTVIKGKFDTINWAKGQYYIKTETDPLGGTTYTILGTSQLLSVPYAMCSMKCLSYSPIFTSVYGTGYLLATNSVTDYTLIPGLTANITVPAGSTHKVIIETSGGLMNTSANTNAITCVAIAIYINGVIAGNGRNYCVVDASTVTGITNPFSFSILNTLTEGSYNIEVRAKKSSTGSYFSDCQISQDATTPRQQGLLNIIQYP